MTGSRLVLAVTLTIGLLAASGGAGAQPARTVRIGWLTTGPHPFIADFRQGLRELGYVEGRDLVIEERYAGATPGRLAELAAELVRLKVDVVVASGLTATAVAREAITGLPVVSISGDPVGAGLVASLARPGGNITGLSILSTEMAAKWVELFHAGFPQVTRIGLLWDGGVISIARDAAQAAGRSLHLELPVLAVRQPDDLKRAFQDAVRARAGGLVVLSSPLFAAHKQRIVGLAAQHRLPAMYEHRDFVEAGGLMSYGPDLRDVFRRAAVFVDKILKGAKPADLPVEQPTKFELVINSATRES